jgi:hypothetical protein
MLQYVMLQLFGQSAAFLSERQSISSYSGSEEGLDVGVA